MKNEKFIIEDKSTIQSIKNISESCIDCKVCMKECHMLSSFTTSPRQLLKEVLHAGSVDAIIPYSCSMCGSCTQVCPKDLKIGNAFMDMRREIANKNGGKSPLKGHNSVHVHQRLSFSKLFSTVAKDDKTSYVKRVFIPGCSLCAYSPELVFKTFNYLKEKLPGTAMVIECCGKPTELLGEEELFSKRYKKLQRTIDELGAEEVITACQSCFLTISQNSPDKKVKSLWTVLEDIGLPEEAKNIGTNSDLIFAIHDSCPTRDRKDIHHSIRYIMSELGYKIEELDHSRENTRCCGNGGMVGPVNPEISLKVMHETAAEGKTDYMVTYCASCRASMIKGRKKALHILDLIFRGPWCSQRGLPHTSSLIESWSNRYKVRIKK